MTTVSSITRKYYPEDDAVRKPVRESPTHLMATRTNLVNKRTSGQIVDRVTCVPKKLATEKPPPVVRTKLQPQQVGINQIAASPPYRADEDVRVPTEELSSNIKRGY